MSTFVGHSGEMSHSPAPYTPNQTLSGEIEKPAPRGVRGKFSEGAKSFSWFFFPAWNAFSQYKISSLVDPKQISVILKVKKGLSSFCNFSSFHFPSFSPNFYPSLFQFSFFFSTISVFPFSDRLAEISRSEVSWGHSTPCLLRHCCPPLLMCMLGKFSIWY